MDGFKSLPKMAHFKEGGSVGVKNIMKKGGKVAKHADAKQDKKVIKKAFSMHDEQLHEGKTDLSGLKKGGRAKKSVGTVKKYKKGGSVANEAKKPSGDAVKLEKVKPTGDKKAAAPSKAAKKPAFKGSDVSKTNKLPAGSSKAKKVSEGPKAAAAPSGAKKEDNKYKTGGKVKKYADGKSVKAPAQQGTVNENDRMANRAANALKYLGPDQQAEFVKQGGMNPAPTKKKGGKVKCMADGGLTAAEQDWLGGADASDPFIMARMRAAIPAATQPSGGSYISSDTDNRDVGQTGGSIDDESAWGNVSPNAAAFNASIPGAGPSAAAPSAPARTPAAAPAPSVNSSWNNQAPNVEQDSGVAYPNARNIPSANFRLPSAYSAPATKGAPVSSQSLFNTLFGGSSSGSSSSPFQSLDQALAAKKGK